MRPQSLTSPEVLSLGDLTVLLVRKRIRHLHLRVLPPDGRVCISAPQRLKTDAIRVFAVSRLDWIRRQQEKLRRLERENPRGYVDGESHALWGRRYRLKVIESPAPSGVELDHEVMILCVPPGADNALRRSVMEAWYRQRLQAAIPPLIEHWERRLGVKIKAVRLRSMKTRWGSCSPRAGTIRLNLELARKPPACLEFIIVHELVHLLEPSHNTHFFNLMDRHLPDWRVSRAALSVVSKKRSDQRSQRPPGSQRPPALL